MDRGKKRLHPLPMQVRNLPDGAMVQASGASYLVIGGKTLRWSFDGYQSAEMEGAALLLTPPSTVRAFQAGYRPVLHPTAMT